MGYYTKHSLNIVSGETDLITELREQSDEARYSLESDGSCSQKSRWYDMEQEMIHFSAKHPYVLFEMTGIGEEFPDFWKKYFKGGKVQTCTGNIIYPPFNESELA